MTTLQNFRQRHSTRPLLTAMDTAARLVLHLGQRITSLEPSVGFNGYQSGCAFFSK
jgi:hypothetical protein